MSVNGYIDVFRSQPCDSGIVHCSVCGAPLHDGAIAFFEPLQGVLCCKGCTPGIAMRYLTPITLDADVVAMLKALP